MIGLDRIPEVRTIRNKIKILSRNDQPQRWLDELSKEWMGQNKELAGVLYIDGHQDVYYGKKQKIPRKYISRMRLALSATTDYWVNDRLGQPFFSITKTVNVGFIKVIKEDIVPKLEKDVPDQPTQEELSSDKHLHKFMLIYDREGYSDDFMLDMWDKRIACSTYNKYVREEWAIEEFKDYEIENEYGEKEIIKLAERGVLIEGKETEKLSEPQIVITSEQTNNKNNIKIKKKYTRKKRQLFIREVRRLTETGHQTSIKSTNYKFSIINIGVYMFARWRQENFFKYMMQNFNIDTLISYFNNKIDDNTMVINPKWREADKKVRSLNVKVKKLKEKFGDLNYKNQFFDEKGVEKIKKFEDKKSKLQEDISIYEKELETLKQQRKDIIRSIKFSELAEDEKFQHVHNERKQFIDTIKLIAVRSETSLVSMIKPHMTKPKEARSLITQFFKSNADITVNKEKKILNIGLHHQATRREDKILEILCKELNKTKTIFPGTDLMINYQIIKKIA